MEFKVTFNKTALIHAVAENSIKTARYLLQQERIDVNVKDILI